MINLFPVRPAGPGGYMRPPTYPGYDLPGTPVDGRVPRRPGTAPNPDQGPYPTLGNNPPRFPGQSPLPGPVIDPRQTNRLITWPPQPAPPQTGIFPPGMPRPVQGQFPGYNLNLWNLLRQLMPPQQNIGLH